MPGDFTCTWDGFRPALSLLLACSSASRLSDLLILFFRDSSFKGVAFEAVLISLLVVPLPSNFEVWQRLFAWRNCQFRGKFVVDIPPNMFTISGPLVLCGTETHVQPDAGGICVGIKDGKKWPWSCAWADDVAAPQIPCAGINCRLFRSPKSSIDVLSFFLRAL